MIQRFTSGLSEYISQYINYQHKLGFAFIKSALYLFHFDKMCAKYYPNATTITEEIGMEWASIPTTGGKVKSVRRMSPVRGLAKYMISVGTPAFVIPTDSPVQKSSYTFCSKLAPYILGLIAQKKIFGSVTYNETFGTLRQFDKLCAEKFTESDTITQDIAIAWAAKRDNETINGLIRRITPIRQLAKYMNREGVAAYIVPADYGKEKHYIPHIFTDDELRKIFKAADELPKSNIVPTRHLVAPVLLRLLYSCGLRPGEGRTLRRTDIDLENGIIKIPFSKGHANRIVPIGEDMLLLCQKYNRVMATLRPDSEFFFPSNKDGSPFVCSWLHCLLDTCIKSAGITNFAGNKPRPYDFRHTFATKALYRWYDEGKDLSGCLPILSSYMGHVEFKSTEYYIHLVPEFFAQLSTAKAQHGADIIPEVMI